MKSSKNSQFQPLRQQYQACEQVHIKQWRRAVTADNGKAFKCMAHLMMEFRQTRGESSH